MLPEDPRLALEKALASAAPNSRLKKAHKVAGVKHSPEFQRVIELPQREYSDEEVAEIVAQFTEVLKTPLGQMILRAAQAMALLEIGMYKGLLAPIRVGGGKTLISLLAAYVLGAVRPLIVLPANAIEPTRERQRDLSKHWRIPYWLHYVSYESLGRLSHETFLEDLNPDCIIADEVHMAANPKAGVTRRLKRFIRGDKSTGLGGHDIPVIALSGTLTKRSLKNYAHLADWALRGGSPMPRTWADVEQWADVIDERKGENPKEQKKVRYKSGALVWFSGGVDDQKAIREGYARHLLGTPGVIGTFDPGPTCSLEVHRVTVPTPRKIFDAYFKLRNDWESPDGWPLTGGLEINRVARQLAMGFYYRPVVRPPAEWLNARRAWAQFVRHTLQYNRQGLDTPAAVAMACIRGDLDDTIYRAWKAVEKSFKLVQEAVWLDGYMVQKAADWLSTEQGIVFCEHIEFAEILSEFTGVPYFGKDASNKEHGHLEKWGGKPAIASLQSCHKIWNLQAWNRGYVCGVPASGQWWEQLLGRFHRDGQEADLVQFDAAIQCLEHSLAVNPERDEKGKPLGQANKDADYIEQTQVQVQKINLADWRWYSDPNNGPVWSKEKPKAKTAEDCWRMVA